MSNLTITEKAIKQYQKGNIPPNGLYIYDTDVKGFGCRISKSCVTWFAQKSLGKGRGSTQRIVIGHYPALSLKDARIKAGHTIVRLAEGEDVHSSRAAAKAAKVERMVCPTISDAVSTYLSERQGNPESGYEKRVKFYLDKAVAEIGASTRINTISKADIRSLLKTRKDAGHYEAARWLFSQLRPFFDWCVHEEHISVSPCVGVVPPSVGKERQHKLTDAEIVAYWQSATPDTNTLDSYYRVLMLTAQRRTEVAAMQWSEVNLDKAEWIIPGSKTKNGREHLVPLAPQAVAILRALPHQRKPHEYVFGKYPDAPVSGFSKAKRELDAAMLAKLRESDVQAKLSDWRLHDVRRTGASGMASLGVQPHIVEAVLNHSPGKLQRTYQVYLYAKEKREALVVWANHISTLLQPQKDTSNIRHLFSQVV